MEAPNFKSAAPQFSGANLAGSGFRVRLREKNILQSLPQQQIPDPSPSTTSEQLGRIFLPLVKTPALFLAPAETLGNSLGGLPTPCLSVDGLTGPMMQAYNHWELTFMQLLLAGRLPFFFWFFDSRWLVGSGVKVIVLIWIFQGFFGDVSHLSKGKIKGPWIVVVCLGDVSWGWNTSQLWGDYFINLDIRIPIIINKTHKLLVCRCFSFSKWAFSGSMLVFQGVRSRKMQWKEGSFCLVQKEEKLPTICPEAKTNISRKRWIVFMLGF